MTKQSLDKAPSGIAGLDEITGGGLPKGRPTLVCGGPGCGKTLLAMEFLVRGATRFNEPGVFMAFEESEADLTENVSSLGFNLRDLTSSKRLVLDHVHIERSEIHETGEYDLEGLFVRLNYAIDAVGAKRVVLDTVEALFAGLPDEGILRSELRRLFRWLKDKKVTALITAEQGEGTLSRYGLEEYVADCVIMLDHRINNQISTRRLRVVKYRGSLHGTNEYPFLIGQSGISVLPITSLGLTHPASSERVPSGVPRLDTMLGGKGYFRGASVLVSGSAGTGKTSLAAAFCEAACERGEQALYFAFEESPEQIIRNMRSVGIELGTWTRKGLLRFEAARPSLRGLEMHLLSMEDAVRETKPNVVVFDPVTNLISIGDGWEVRSMLTRLIDYLKTVQITSVFTALISEHASDHDLDLGVSSLMDTWILLRNTEQSGERNRLLHVLKSRGMPHSNQVREFQLSSEGIELVDVYLGAGTVLTGAARLAQQAGEHAEGEVRRVRIERLEREITRQRESAAAQLTALQAKTESELEQLQNVLNEERSRAAKLKRDELDMARQRSADENGKPALRRNPSGRPKA